MYVIVPLDNEDSDQSAISTGMHYENKPMQHTGTFHGSKNANFQLILFY